MLRIRSVVLNANDLPRAVAFWSAALGYEPVRPVEDDWATLGPPGGDGPLVSIQLSDQDPPDIPHVHLDLDVDDAAAQAAEVERLVGLGAERVDWDLYPDEPHDFVVLADPDGNRFCVIDRSFGSG
jgi:catechol 2,3-dioxygenase-like lactoylglutathione lyase family enzyme